MKKAHRSCRIMNDYIETALMRDDGKVARDSTPPSGG